MNNFVAIGRAGADPTLKVTEGGKSVANVNICVQRPTKDKEGKYKTDWFQVEAWQKTGEILAEYVRKGHKFGVAGRIEIESWVSAQGKPGTTVKIVADKIELIEAPPGKGEPQQDPNEKATLEQAGALFAS